MAKNREPVLLELAHLPREQVGPFLLLGLDKDASKEDIEGKWAERVKWARKQLITLTLEEINWAREIVCDPQKRIAADVLSLNADTIEHTVGKLGRSYGLGEDRRGVGWEPLDEEKELADYQPAIEVPDPQEIRSTIVVPEIPEEVPAAGRLLEQLVQSPLDPWLIQL